MKFLFALMMVLTCSNVFAEGEATLVKYTTLKDLTINQGSLSIDGHIISARAVGENSCSLIGIKLNPAINEIKKETTFVVSQGSSIGRPDDMSFKYQGNAYNYLYPKSEMEAGNRNAYVIYATCVTEMHIGKTKALKNLMTADEAMEVFSDIFKAE